MSNHIINRLINTGIRKGMAFREVNRTRQANFFMIAPVVVYLFFIGVGIVYRQYLVVWLGLAAIAGNAAGLLLNHRGRYGLARNVPLIINSVLILLISNIYDYGEKLPYFYFPILVTYAGYYHFRDDFRNMMKSFVVTAACILLHIFLPHNFFGSYTTTPGLVTVVNTVVVLLAMLLFFGFLKVLMDYNFKNEKAYQDLLDESVRNAAALEEARAKAEMAAAAKGQFVSNMSHELRTPLNGIIGSTNLLLQEEVLPRQQQYLEVLKYSSEHMLSLVNDVLDFSKIDAGKMQLDARSFNLKQCVEGLTGFFGPQIRQKGLSFILDIDEALNRHFISDETRLGQVLHNLVSNAIKFTSKGGVRVEVTSEGNSTVGTLVRFAVADTGIGIPPEKQQLIFEGFEQVNTGTARLYGGTGLGLSISKSLVALFGGRLQVHSIPGGGSTFYFTIALTPAGQQPYITAGAAQALGRLDNLRVLLAEDNPVNMLIAEVFLQKWGASVTTATNGKELLAHFAAQEFDVLLVDLEMPVIDGYEAIAQIRQQGSKVKAVAFTAAVYDNLFQQLKDKGFDDYLQKPFRPEELHSKLKAGTPA